MKRRIKWTLIIILVLLLLPIPFFGICHLVYSGSADDEQVAYLKQNSCQMSENNYHIPDNFIEAPQPGKPNIFIFSEVHGFSPSLPFSAEIFIHLNKEYGVRKFCIEMCDDPMEKIRALMTNDSISERQLKDNLKSIAKQNEPNIPQWNTEDFINMFVRLHQYNLSLPNSSRIQFYALVGNSASDKGREDRMTNSMLKIVKTDSAKISNSQLYYCLVGHGHGFAGPLMAEGEKYYTFAARLSRQGYNVRVMMQYAVDREMYMPKAYAPYAPDDEKTTMACSDGPITYIPGMESLKAVTAESSLTMFRLNGKNSPYARSTDLVFAKGPLAAMFTGNYKVPDGYHTTDYFQYVFLIRGHKAPNFK